MKYSEKLKSPKWQKKRLEILQRDNFKCRYCNDSETELQVHHLKYNKEPWDANNEDLICLCKDCHFIQEGIKAISKKVICVDKKSVEDYIILVVKHETINNRIVLSLFEKHKELEWRFMTHIDTKGHLINTINKLING